MAAPLQLPPGQKRPGGHTSSQGMPMQLPPTYTSFTVLPPSAAQEAGAGVTEKPESGDGHMATVAPTLGLPDYTFTYSPVRLFRSVGPAKSESFHSEAAAPTHAPNT